MVNLINLERFMLIIILNKSLQNLNTSQCNNSKILNVFSVANILPLLIVFHIYFHALILYVLCASKMLLLTSKHTSSAHKTCNQICYRIYDQTLKQGGLYKN